MGPVPRGGLADALSRALAERSRAIHSESEESTSDTTDDDEWDDQIRSQVSRKIFLTHFNHIKIYYIFIIFIFYIKSTQ